MSLETLRNSFHAQALGFRNIDTILQSDNFAIAYGVVSKEDQEFIESLIYGDAFDVNRDIIPNKKVIKQFINRQLKSLTPFHRMGIRKLREIGCNLSINDCFILNKATLIEEIENVAARLKKDGG